MTVSFNVEMCVWHASEGKAISVSKLCSCQVNTVKVAGNPYIEESVRMSPANLNT